jgi:hypothetical protein
MRLDALRETGFMETAIEIAGSYRDEIKWPDQDVINIYCARFKGMHIVCFLVSLLSACLSQQDFYLTHVTKLMA